jgi:branched-chain amino acid aminotransferase
MAAGFSLSLYPVRYEARFNEQKTWRETWTETVHMSPEAEKALSPEELNGLLTQRNDAGGFPLVSYTSQYGFGVFEGLKAYPQKDGSLKMFRPDRNAARFRRSMEGMKMPGFPEELFLHAVDEVVHRNAKLGFRPQYDQSWEKDHFISAQAVYVRPFTLSEGGIGVNISRHPWAIILATPVGSYFDPDVSSAAVTTNKVRATPNGTGWIKCDSNYVIPALAKTDAIAQGFMEAVFLDAKEGKYIEEGSSCNIFFLLKDGSLVTPSLGDTILPGINRESVLTLAKDLGIRTVERQISIQEAQDQAQECFVTGTAAGVSFIESLTHQGRKATFNSGKIGELTTTLLQTLKGIQYGAMPDKHNWMYPVGN